LQGRFWEYDFILSDDCYLVEDMRDWLGYLMGRDDEVKMVADPIFSEYCADILKRLKKLGKPIPGSDIYKPTPAIELLQEGQWPCSILFLTIE